MIFPPNPSRAVQVRVRSSVHRRGLSSVYIAVLPSRLFFIFWPVCVYIAFHHLSIISCSVVYVSVVLSSVWIVFHCSLYIVVNQSSSKGRRKKKRRERERERGTDRLLKGEGDPRRIKKRNKTKARLVQQIHLLLKATIPTIPTPSTPSTPSTINTISDHLRHLLCLPYQSTHLQ